MWHVWWSNGKLVTSRKQDDLKIWCGTQDTFPSWKTTACTSRNSLFGSALQMARVSGHVHTRQGQDPNGKETLIKLDKA